MNRRTCTGLTGFLLLTLAIALALVAGSMDAADAKLEQEHYCRMVYQWQESRGEFGWPDYRNEYEDICNE
jgi:hypothetical protein